MRALVAIGSRALPAAPRARRRSTSIALWLALTPLLILLAPPRIEVDAPDVRVRLGIL